MDKVAGKEQKCLYCLSIEQLFKNLPFPLTCLVVFAEVNSLYASEEVSPLLQRELCRGFFLGQGVLCSKCIQWFIKYNFCDGTTFS